MAGRLGLLCRDPALRARMAQASCRIIGEHDQNRVLVRWESIYRALARPGAGDTPAARARARAAAAMSAAAKAPRRKTAAGEKNK
jgi:hypothetical protein